MRVPRTKKEVVLEAISMVQHLSSVFLRRRAELAAEVGLTEQQWLLLERISEEHFMPSMFAKERESSPAAVSKILRQLTDKGFIASALNDCDGRKRAYTLTAAGKRIMTVLRSHREQAVDRIWMGMDERSLNEFCDFGAQLVASIESYSRKEG